MNIFEESLLRTYIELIRHSDKPGLAALIVDAEIGINEDCGYLSEILIALPACYASTVLDDELILNIFESA
ncbi:hypothetical protein [Chamaesiphon sp.]|uniref:hypothetical protein n=1 Tax=Chamaesiphon sp. TaxID=2814140 RepID=UPI003592ED42